MLGKQKKTQTTTYIFITKVEKLRVLHCCCNERAVTRICSNQNHLDTDVTPTFSNKATNPLFYTQKKEKKKKQQTHSYINVVTLARPPEKDWFIKPICKELTLIMPTAYISR
jgi:hypothetical protein